MLNNKKLLSNTILYSVGEIVPRLLALLLLPVLTIYLTTEEYGINSYTTSVMTFLFVIASLSLNTYILKQFYNLDHEEERKELIGSVFYFILLFNFILLLLEFLFLPTLIEVFKINIPFYPFFLLAILNNFFDVISIIPLVVLRVNENARGFILMSLSRTILQYVLVLILVVHFGYGLEGSYYGRLIANIPFVFLYLIYINKNGNFTIKKSIIKNAIKFSLPLLPGSISYIVISLSDRIVLERYISLSMLGIYSVAFTLALTLNVIIQAIYKSFEPIIFKEFNNERFESLNQTLYRNYLIIILLGGFGISAFSKEIFTIATSENFLVGYKLVPFLVISVLISGVNIYLDMLLIANLRQKVVSYTTILSGVLSITLNFILIPRLGYAGAIIASIISFLVVNIICQRLVFIKEKYFLQQFLVLTVIALFPLTYEYFVGLNGFFINVFIKILILIAFSFLVLKLFRFDFLQLFKLFKSFRSKISN